MMYVALSLRPELQPAGSDRKLEGYLATLTFSLGLSHRALRLPLSPLLTTQKILGALWMAKLCPGDLPVSSLPSLADYTGSWETQCHVRGDSKQSSNSFNPQCFFSLSEGPYACHQNLYVKQTRHCIFHCSNPQEDQTASHGAGLL